MLRSDGIRFLIACLTVLSLAVGGPAADKKGVAKKQPARTDLYGDPLPEGAVARLGTVRIRHAAPVACFQFSPEGKVLAAGDWDGTVSLWDVGSRKLLRQFRGSPHGSVHSVAFSPDGKALAVARDDPVIGVWEIATGKTMHRLRGHRQSVNSVAFSPDGKTLLSGGGSTSKPTGKEADNSIRLWNLATGKELCLHRGGGSVISSVAFSPDGRMFASEFRPMVVGETAKTVLWETASGKKIRQFPAKEGVHWSVSFAPDGRALAVWGGTTIMLQEVASGRPLLSLRGHRKVVDAVAFSPDAKVLVSASRYGALQVWNLATGRQTRRLPTPGKSVSSLAFSPDGKTLALLADEEHTVRLWDVPTWKDRQPAGGHRNGVGSVTLSRDGKTAASVDWEMVAVVTDEEEATVWFWDTGSGRERHRLRGSRAWFDSAALAPDGRIVAFAGSDNAIHLKDAASGRETAKFPGPKFPGANDYMRSVAFSPDGKLLLAPCSDRSLRLWEVAAGKEIRKLQPGDWVECVAWSPDGKTIACLGQMEPVRWYAVETGGELHRTEPLVDWLGMPLKPLPEIRFRSALAFSPDGKSLVRTGLFFQVLEVSTGKERSRLCKGNFSSPSVAIAPDGRTLAVAEEGRRCVRLWDLVAGKELPRLLGHRGPVTSVAFSQDGTMLVSASMDTTVLVWDTARLPKGRPPRQVELAAKEIEACWSDLAGDDASRAYKVILALTASPRKAVPFLREHLRPVALPSSRRLARLIADLDSERFAVRDRAARALELFQEAAIPPLQRALQDRPPPEMRFRMQRLVRRLARERHVPSPDRLRTLRAIEVLEHTGTPAARDVLGVLAKGAPAACVTQEAEASLRRLAGRAARKP